MNTEYTLSIIKPDAVRDKKAGDIISFLENKEFKIVAKKKIILHKKQAEEFYNIHKERPFFRELINFITSGPVIVQVLEKENAISYYREVMGNTNPEKAEDNSIRKLFGANIQCNAVHGSDSKENAKREISFFFSELEIIR